MHFQRSVTICLVAMFLCQCAPGRSDLESVRIAVAMTPLSTAFFVAQSSGIFRQCGLDPELIQVNGGKRAFDLLDQGVVDFSTSSDSVASYAVHQGKQSFNILASFASSENDIKLISRTRETITDVSRIGYWGDSSSEHLLRTYLSLYAPEQRFNLVNAPPEQLVGLFRDNQVDVISVWEPFAWQMSEMIDRNQAFVLDTDALHSLHFLLLSRQDTALDPTIAERIIGALQLATIETHIQPEQAQQAMISILNSDQSFIDWIWEDYLFQVKPATSIRYALLSNSRWFNDSQQLDYQPYLERAETQSTPTALAKKWCKTP